jgi:hypothetical protein
VPLYEHGNVRVTVRDGTVILRGHVHSRRRADQLMAGVTSVPGVLGVENRLACDNEMEIELARALATDPRTRSCRSVVRVRDGIVMLDGEAPDAATAEAATKVVAAHGAVRGVVNHLRAPRFRPLTSPGLQPAIGAIVYADDGPVGSITRVIIDPSNRRLAAVIAQVDAHVDGRTPSTPSEGEVIVPASAIRDSTPAIVTIRGHLDDLLRGTVAAGCIQAAPPTWQPPFPYEPGQVVWPARSGPEITSGRVTREALVAAAM